jgi:hypothetical protein
MRGRLGVVVVVVAVLAWGPGAGCRRDSTRYESGWRIPELEPLELPDAPTSALPDGLWPEARQEGMRPIKARVQECYERFKVPGMVTVTLTIAPSGRVSSVTAIGRFAGTATGACVANIVKGATFRPFNGPPVTMTYPFVLRPPNP